MKLKGLLKSVFILLLTLLPISFSSAFEIYSLNEPKAIYNLGESAIFTFTNGANFNINSEYFLFQHKSLSYNYYHTLFWSNTGLYLMSSYENATSYLTQGFIQKYCQRPYITESTDVNGFRTNCNYLPITDILNSDSYKNPSEFVYGLDPNGGYPNFCFNYDSLDISICFSVATNSLNDSSQLKYSLGFTRNDFFYNISDSVKSYITTSPFSQGSSDSESPVSDIVFYSDNNQVYYDFLTLLGYNSGLCYGDFALTDITITDGNSFQFFPSDVGTGANIFTLKDYRYSNFDNYSWYGQLRGLYNVSNRNNDYTSFMGKSKGYYRLVYKVENQSYFSAYQPNGTDLFIYCDMALNGFDPNGLFTGKLSSSATNIFINSDYRNYYGENKDGEFVLSGANFYFSGEDVGYFDLFNRLYTRFKNGFKVDGSEDYRVGILPSFVIFGFFLMLLLYLFKR